MISENEFVEIAGTIEKTYQYDLSVYTPVIIKRRISDALKLLDYNINGFLNRVVTDRVFFDNFLYILSVDEMDLFRDPDMWLTLRNKILPALTNKSRVRIWLPDATSGEEMYSVIILLIESGLYQNSEIIATSLSSINIEKMQQGIYNKRRIESNNANYIKSGGNGSLSDYYTATGKNIHMHNTLLERVVFFNEKITSFTQTEINLVIFRNKMLYYKSEHNENILNIISKALQYAGFVICGIKEAPEYLKNNFSVFDKNSCIYTKL